MDGRYIVIFDGVCNFCNSSVNFIIKRDPKGLFLFTPMQSEYAQELINEHKMYNVGVDTFLLIKNEQCYTYTSAALEIARELNGYWYFFIIFKIVPKKLRDCIYILFARNRYSLFGKKETCMIPTDETKSRFIGI